MGLVSSAIAGHIGDGIHNIGAMEIGVSIFNFLYYNCHFVRMGTCGLTAQAFGKGDFKETTRMLIRALLVAAFLGVLLLIFKQPIGDFAVWAMNGDDLVADYFAIRIWGVPAGVMLFGVYGWLTGMQNATIPMIASLFVNILHCILSFIFADNMQMGIGGIATASVVSQWSGLTLATILLLIKFHKQLQRISIIEVFDLKAFSQFFHINLDIIIRSFLLCSVYTFFTAASARMGSLEILAINTLLMQLYSLFTNMCDGFAVATEALTGRFVGEKNEKDLRKCIKCSFVWSIVIAVAADMVYLGWWKEIIPLFVSDDCNIPILITLTQSYIGWVVAIPLVSAIPFIFDGIMVGITMSKAMRNSMIVSTVFFYGLFFAFQNSLGNDAIWLAMTIFMTLRGVFQYIFSGKMKDIYAKAR